MVDDHEIDCDRALVQLYQFLDGELTIERRRTIEVHLNGCTHCFSSFDFEQELRLVVRSKLRTEVPSGLLARITGLIDSERRSAENPSAG